jgi:hypothetical protein
LQPLDLAVLRAGDRLRAGQPGQGLVAIARQQQALQVVAEARRCARLENRMSKRWA